MSDYDLLLRINVEIEKKGRARISRPVIPLTQRAASE
jgi:hypothetical protein